MPRNEGFLGRRVRGFVTRWSKAECSQDRGTPCLPVSHPKQLNSVYKVYTKICLGSLVDITLHLCFHPPTHPSSYSPFWAFVSLKRGLHSSLTPARLLHPSTHRTRNASLQTTSPRLPLRFTPDFVLCYTFVYRE